MEIVIFAVLLTLVLMGMTTFFYHVRQHQKKTRVEREELIQRLEADADIDRPRITHLADGGWRFEFDDGTLVELGPGRARVNAAAGRVVREMRS